MTRPGIVAAVLFLLVGIPGLHATKRPAEVDGTKRPASVPAEGGGDAVATIELGTLTLRTEPEVDILWEGTPLTQTNIEGTLEIGDIPPGAYTITLRKPGYETLSERIQISPGHQTQAITLTPIVVSQPDEPSGADADIIPIPPDASVADIGAGLAPALDEMTKRPASVPADPTPTPSPPIPSNRTTTNDSYSPLLWTALAATLILLAFTTAWLMSRRTKRQKAVTKSATPNVVLAERTPTRRDAPSFVNDLRQREDTLDTFVTAARNRIKREVKIIDAEVVDRKVPEEDDE